MNQLDDVQRKVLLEGVEDYVGFWEIIKAIRRRHPTSPDEEIRTATLHLIGGLLVAGYLRPGTPTRAGGFIQWDLPVEEALSRIDAEWRSLGRDPDIGEIVWFTTTDSGKRIVQEVEPPA